MKSSNKLYLFLPVAFALLCAVAFFFLPVGSQVVEIVIDGFVKVVYAVIGLVALFLLYRREYKNLLLWVAGLFAAYALGFIGLILGLVWGTGS